MKKLTTSEALELAMSVLQMIRQAYPDHAQFPLAAAATLVACLSTPGVRQGDLTEMVGDLSGAAIGRQLDILQARGRGEDAPRLIYKTKNAENFRENDIVVTEQGQQFMRALTDEINRRLAH